MKKILGIIMLIVASAFLGGLAFAGTLCNLAVKEGRDGYIENTSIASLRGTPKFREYHFEMPKWHKKRCGNLTPYFGFYY